MDYWFPVYNWGKWDSERLNIPRICSRGRFESKAPTPHCHSLSVFGRKFHPEWVVSLDWVVSFVTVTITLADTLENQRFSGIFVGFFFGFFFFCFFCVLLPSPVRERGPTRTIFSQFSSPVLRGQKQGSAPFIVGVHTSSFNYFAGFPCKILSW